MANCSRKFYQEKIKAAKAKLHSFEHLEALDFILRQKNDWQPGGLPEAVANNPNQEEKETKQFLICFDDLNMNECKFDPFTPSKAEALVRKLKIITDCEVRNIRSIISNSVEKIGEYKSLFNKLDPGVQKLHENDFADEGRIFFFNMEEKCNVVSIETTHRNIDR